MTESLLDYLKSYIKSNSRLHFQMFSGPTVYIALYIWFWVPLFISHCIFGFGSHCISHCIFGFGSYCIFRIVYLVSGPTVYIALYIWFRVPLYISHCIFGFGSHCLYRIVYLYFFVQCTLIMIKICTLIMIKIISNVHEKDYFNVVYMMLLLPFVNCSKPDRILN